MRVIFTRMYLWVADLKYSCSLSIKNMKRRFRCMEANMDVTNIANLATSLAQQRNDMDVSVAVFKKALDAQSSAALSLIAAIPTVSLPPHLGNNVNTKA